uniref:NADH-ubiquinone oxidoreductase chain 1 n=1 Tax=Cicadellidae gen. sp. 1 JCX-2018 TaxID=2306300 RepID=A0A346RNJ8_9HEMI|nr:NADH dehydrogenase subunit 1 [Cicadellidae gen. sp. 1 JCX-2018]
MYFFTFTFLIIYIMISVGFFTLMERSVLGYIHFRKGPNKVGYLGLLQPFSDGIKLFNKENLFPVNSNYLMYFICPFIMLLHSLFLWVLFPNCLNCIEFKYCLVFFLCCFSVSIYMVMLCGWSSNSMYSMLGCLRSVSQAISYEVSLALVLICFFILVDGYSLLDFYFLNLYLWFMLLAFPMFLAWLACCLAETNRTPFDFSEGESELVSGFNVEYGGGLFALLFISEYSSIIFISLFSCSVFLGSDYSSFWFYISVIYMCFFFVWVRSSLPRFRYDKLMYLSWKCYLPMSLNYMLFFFLLSVVVFYQFFLLS